jgi:hypothetical protein
MSLVPSSSEAPNHFGAERLWRSAQHAGANVVGSCKMKGSEAPDSLRRQAIGGEREARGGVHARELPPRIAE